MKYLLYWEIGGWLDGIEKLAMTKKKLATLRWNLQFVLRVSTQTSMFQMAHLMLADDLGKVWESPLCYWFWWHESCQTEIKHGEQLWHGNRRGHCWRHSYTCSGDLMIKRIMERSWGMALQERPKEVTVKLGPWLPWKPSIKKIKERNGDLESCGSLQSQMKDKIGKC